MQELLRTGRLVRAEVWLALQLRRAAFASVFEALVIVYEQNVQSESKPSPAYEALLRTEILIQNQVS
jgi:hypothetical protein